MTDERTAVLVTGAARGIGRATADRFAEDDDYDVVAMLDVAPEVEDAADDVAGGVAYEVDVSDHDAVREAVEDIEASADVTAVVNNAGISRYFWIEDLAPEEWDRVLAVNLTGQYNVARWTAPKMYRRGEGSLVNISSGAGVRGSISGGVHYSASKAGVFGLTYGLAKQLSPHVRVNCVVPGLVQTAIGEADDDADDGGLWTDEGVETMLRMTPLQRYGQPDEVAEVVHFLSGEGASYVTGSTVTVNGGNHLLPTQEFLMPEKSLKPDVE